jgi:tetratricopeptide (TPR) repeat protein
MNQDKLKESARKYEQSGQWRLAIEVYKKALREFEESGEGVPDPSLYNRIGDLEMREGDSGAAIRAYEQASDLYTEQGFFNNAIALCSKILRANPARSATYLRLAQLNARKNFVNDSKRNLIEYIERMDALHHREEAFAAITMFADQFSGNPDIRLMLVELLRASSRDEEAREQLEKLAGELEAKGDSSGARATRERLAAIDTDVEPTQRPVDSDSGLVFLDVGGESMPPTRVASIDGLDVISSDPDAAGWRADSDPVEGLEFTDLHGSDAGGDLPELLTESPFGELEAEPLDPVADALDIDAYPSVDRDGTIAPGGELEGEVISFETLEAATNAGEETPDGLVFLPVDEGEPDLAERIEDVAAYARDRARVLFEIGDGAGGVAALEEALRQFEATSRLTEALDVAEELIRYEPDVIFRYQKRVELAYRANDRHAMVHSYLGLADALLRSGGLEHAVTVYRRVLDHDADNPQARSALAMLEATKGGASVAPAPSPTAPPVVPPVATAPPAESFIDLGSLILDEPQSRDTRMKVDQAAPIEDEDEAFHEALAQFKRGIDENIDAEDFQAHYDLGIAFKEMGLLDEAIAQFQKALRAPEGRLKTSEQLGISFFDKSRFAIAEAVLRRATDSLPGGDEEKIGLIYWLGRALEAQRRYEEALRYYERVLAVDIRFLDVGDRVHRLTTGAS